MAVTIDWPNRIINVPRADLVLVQSSPVEIREMNLNWFRLQLKALEDDPAGMAYPDTHRHNTEVTLGGLTFARVIEIINDYTVTFEDGQYAVNLVSANSNVGDRVNVNQVSVRSSNSAGMTSSPDIEYSSFNGGVHINSNSPYSGTVFPTGTPRMPVNNLADAMLIANYRGFTTFYVYGDLIIDSGGNYTGMIFIGESKTKSTFTVTDESVVDDCEFFDAHLTGILDGDSTVHQCLLDNLLYITGFIEQCVLDQGVITLGHGSAAHFLDCWSGVPGTSTPVIDMGGAGQSLAMRNYNGGITLINKTGPEQVSLDINSGQVKIDLTTVTNGTIVIRGIGKVIELTTGEPLYTGNYGNLTILNEAMSKETIAEAVALEVGEEIQYSSYDNGVTIDTVNGTDSSEYPYGTPGFPCKTVANSYAIRMARGFSKIYLKSDLHLSGIPDGILHGLHLIGVGGNRVHTLSGDNILLEHCIAENVIATGSCKSGSSIALFNCHIDGITNCSLEATGCHITGGTYFETELTDCHLTGNLTVQPGGYLSGIGIVFEGDTNTIDMQGQVTTVSLDIASGYVEILNSVTGSLAEFNLGGGELELNANCTGGTLYVEGHGILYNNGTFDEVTNNLVSNYMPDATWSYNRDA